MKSSKLLAPLAAVAIVLGSAASLVACSSDDSSANPQPTVHDSGTAADSTTGGDSSPGNDGATTMDSAVIDTGTCMSDATTCNSCYTPQQAAQDPYNACAPSTANCIKFDNSRVPANVPAP